MCLSKLIENIIDYAPAFNVTLNSKTHLNVRRASDIVASAEMFLTQSNTRRLGLTQRQLALAACNDLLRGRALTIANPEEYQYVPLCYSGQLIKLSSTHSPAAT